MAARAALVIQDALENPLFKDNPSVTERGFRFYAGVPLFAAHGEAVGTLCILDFEPHAFTHLDLELLGIMSRRLLAALEVRQSREGARASASVPDQRADDEALGTYSRELFAELVAVWTSRSVQRRAPAALAAVAVPPELRQRALEGLEEIADGGLIGRLGPARFAALMHDKNAAEAQEALSRALGEDASVIATNLDGYQGAPGLALRHVEQALGDAGLA